MMEAVGRKKAHWLFGARGSEVFVGKTRPQEDMVTSAVFGSVMLLSIADRRAALDILLGLDAWKTASFDLTQDIEIHLWPRLKGVDGKPVEPDVLLTCGSRTLVVEVKWHASLSDQQIDKQIEAVRRAGRYGEVVASVMLGNAVVETVIASLPCVARTWREVSGAVQAHPGTGPGLGRWLRQVEAFLGETDMGRIYRGLPELQHVERASYQFEKPGHPPWLARPLPTATATHYTFGETE
jgi:hypothetical protein